MTKAIPTDPYLNNSPSLNEWHLVGTWGLHADKVWRDYTGLGTKVAIIDDGFQYTHADLSANYRTDLDWDTVTKTGNAMAGSADSHGTAVLGVIAADDNGTGSVGVAFDSQAYGIRIGFGAQSSLANTLDAFQYALTSHAHVINNSWGYPSPFADNKLINFTGTDISDINAAIKNLADFGRDGLGTNIVFAAGNSRATGDNANYHNLQNDIHSITVAAIKEDGTYASFSNAGANILASTAGVNVITTDKTGTDGYTSTDYGYFNGTSASAPIMSGLISLMLEANHNLGWRDVQEIIAYSTQFNDATSTGWHYNGANNWNGGGLHFSHDYGFGAADAYTAIRLAETWGLQQTSSNMVTSAAFTQSPHQTITNAAGIGSITTSMNITQDIQLEHVIINLDITHARAGDLTVTLISPTGMESVLIDHPSNGAFTSLYGISGIHFETTSVADWGEHSAGVWSLRVEDNVSGNTGVLNSWSLSFTGNTISADDTYIYTNDFAKVLNDGHHTNIITDTNGGIDTLNVAAVSSDSNIDLSLHTALIAGKSVTIAAGTTLENIFVGDGNDILHGNEVANHLMGGRGNDSLYGLAGADTIDGGTGNDYISGGADNDVLNGDAGDDRIFGGDGIDTMHGGTGNDSLYSGNGNDLLTGDDGNDVLNGDAGNDMIYGGAGDDNIFGGAGDDLMIGGTGYDMLNGYTGHDIFGFTALDGQFDRVISFTRGGTEGDKLNITDLLQGFDPLGKLIDDFVHLTQTATKTFISVNADGVGNDFVNVACIYGSALSTGNVQGLLDDGTLVVNHSLL